MAERPENAPELIDEYTWEKTKKIITQDVHGIPGLANFAHFARTVSQPSSQVHKHENLMEIYCVVKGRRESRIFHEDGTIESYSCTGNESLIVYPGEVHANGTAGQEPCESYAFQLETDPTGGFLGLDQDYGKRLCARMVQRRNRHIRVDNECMRLIKRAFQLIASGNSESGAAHIVTFLFEYAQMPELGVTPRKPGDLKIMRALEYIDANIHDTIALEDLARSAGYSLSRFKSKFREETGHTPGAYIASAKVERAKKMLKETNRTITEIAVDLGWSSSNYFCSVFRKLTGVSPLQYRKRG